MGAPHVRATQRFPPMHERRRYTRFAAQQPVWCETDAWTVWVRTVDLSAGGLFIPSPRPPEPGRVVRLIMDRIGVVAQARVAWHGSTGAAATGMGLSIDAFEAGQDAYLQLVQEMSSQRLR
jgi:hypothetical protein